MRQMTLQLASLRALLFVLALVLAPLLGMAASPAYAATRTVTTTADSGAGSLRQAIADAISGDTITFNLSGCPCTITLANQLEIDKNLTITGLGASNLTISGNNAVRVFLVNAGNTLNLSDVTVANGSAPGNDDGGGIYNNAGTVTVTGSTFSNNTTRYGGGIQNFHGTVTVTGSTFSSNTARIVNGGGIFNFYGTLTVTGSTFSNNSAADDGGGISNFNESILNVSNSTFFSNSASEGGGISDLAGVITVSNSTFSNNSAISGGGIGGTVFNLNLSNTIIANSLSGGNCGVGIGYTSESGNLSSDDTCDFAASRENIDPKLGPLANNGGPTLTMALLLGSPAINTVSCGLATDQRGVARPQFDVCDSGAYEYDGPVPTISVNPPNLPNGTVGASYSQQLSASGGSASYTFALSNGSLPNGLALSSAGLLSGTPTQVGTFSFTVQATDASRFSGSREYTLTIAKISTTTTIIDDTPDPSNVGQAITVKYTVTASAGTPTGNVTVGDGTVSCIGTVAAGQCDLTFTSSGAKTITASYAGDTTFSASISAGEPHSVLVPNRAPIASNDSYSTAENTVLTISAPGVLANDSDPDAGTTLTAVLVSGPSHGAVVLNANGSFVYQPAAGYAGADSFTYAASDGAATSNVATVRLSVKQAFPTTAVLDNFNRANGKLGGNWDGLTDQAFYKIASNTLDVQLGGPLVWKPASFGATQEAFVTLRTIDSKNPSQGLLLKVQTGNVPNAGAISVVYDAKAKAVRVSALRLERKGTWTLYPNQAATFANGDVLGARANANGTVTIYKNGALVATVTLNTADQAFFNSKGGKIGIWTVAASAAVLDDFGGGNVVAQ